MRSILGAVARIARRPALLIGAVAAAVVVGAAVVGVVATGDDARPEPERRAVLAAPSPSVSSTSVPPAPVPSAPAHDDGAPAAPTDFRIAGPEFDIQATVCGMPFVRPLDPPGDQYHTVCWVERDFGVAPGSASGGTTYILGHSWAYAQLVLNQLSERATLEYPGAGPQYEGGIPIYPVTGLAGYRIWLTTPNGTLGYDVSRAYLVGKNDAGSVQSLMANSPDRVVIITCAVKEGRDLDYNVIVEAQISSSTKA